MYDYWNGPKGLRLMEDTEDIDEARELMDSYQIYEIVEMPDLDTFIDDDEEEGL